MPLACLGMHRYPVQVRFYELDPYGHLNHSVYVQYFETGRIALLDEVGHSLPAMLERGLMIVVSEIRTRFLGSAGFGDELVVETGVVDFRRVTTRWWQRIVRGDEVLATQDLRAAMLDRDARPTRFPEALVEALEPYRVAVP